MLNVHLVRGFAQTANPEARWSQIITARNSFLRPVISLIGCIGMLSPTTPVLERRSMRTWTTSEPCLRPQCQHPLEADGHRPSGANFCAVPQFADSP
jgi:hypothetical protein